MGLLLSRELPGAVSWVGDELAVDGVQGGPSGRCQCAAGPGLEGRMGRVAPLGEWCAHSPLELPEERGQAFAHGALSVVLTLVLVKGKSHK